MGPRVSLSHIPTHAPFVNTGGGPATPKGAGDCVKTTAGRGRKAAAGGSSQETGGEEKGRGGKAEAGRVVTQAGDQMVYSSHCCLKLGIER